MSTADWLASSVNVRLRCAAEAIIQIVENSANETVN